MRRLCVITGSRADYGLLRWLMQEIADDPGLALQVVATGSHLSEAFGLTRREIEADGFTLDAAVDLGLDDDSHLAIARASGRAVTGIAEALERLRPDLVVVLGDRFEIFAAAQAAYLLHIPVAHLHGGEITEGALDDALRHAITKLSALHFVAAGAFRDRVLQLGEAPERVHVVGAAGLDAIARLDLPGRAALEQELGVSLGEPLLLVTYHPETLAARDPGADAAALLSALDAFPEAGVVLTRPNADPGNAAIAERIAAWSAANAGRARLFDSLGQRRYLAMLKLAAVAVGNSSSALIEAPAVGTPSVNIGGRQGGRPRGSSVIDCPPESEAIRRAIGQALEPPLQDAARRGDSPYGGPGAAAKIKAVLASVDLAALRAKHFRDLPLAAGAGA